MNPRFLLTLLLLLPAVARADDGEVTKIGDVHVVAMKAMSGLRYDVTRFQVPPGVKVRIDLENVDSMMHNLVVTKPGRRVNVADAATKMGVDAAAENFIPRTPDVLWHSNVLQPGEKAVVEFTSPEQPGIYPYVCTYPGHGSVMYGAMYVGDQKLPDIAKDENVPPTVVGDTDAQRTGPRVLRTFLRDCGPAAIAADTGNGISYAFDAGACRLRYAWKGGFVDTAMAFTGNGKDFVEPVGRIWWRADDAFPIRMADSSSPQVKFVGYRIIKGIAEFEYTVDGVTVKERISEIPQPAAAPGGHAVPDHGAHDHAHAAATTKPALPAKVGLVRSFAVGPTDKPVTFVAGDGSGAAFASSVGQFAAGVLKLTPQQAATFDITMTEQPGVQPLVYCTMNDRLGSAQPKAGYIARAGSFDGSKTTVPLGIKTDQLGNAWTFTAWIQPDAKIAQHGALLAAGDQSASFFAVLYNATTGQIELTHQMPKPADTVLKLPKGEKPVFRHVAVVVSGGEAAIYIDGEPRGHGPAGALVPQAEFHLGSLGKSLVFKGLIDEAKVFDRALSNDDLKSMITRDKGRAAAPQIQR